MRQPTIYVSETCNTSTFRLVRGNLTAYCTRHGMLVRVCACCQKTFHVKRIHTATCSNACRMALSRINKTAAQVEV